MADYLIAANAAADTLARQAAERGRSPEAQRAMVRLQGQRVTSLAKRLGRANAFANSYPIPGEGARRIRDATGPLRAAARLQGCKRKAPPAGAAAVLGSSYRASPRMAALRQRVLARERLAAEAASKACTPP